MLTAQFPATDSPPKKCQLEAAREPPKQAEAAKLTFDREPKWVNASVFLLLHNKILQL
jgi:hypothetical protein